MFGRLVGQRIGDQRLQVFVEDFMLLVRQLLEAGKGSVQLVAFQCDAQLLQARTERGATGVLAHDHLVGVPAHRLGGHDLVGLAMLEHAVLVDTRLVGEGIGADDGLVRLHRKAGDARDQARGGEDVLGLDAGVHVEQVLAGLDRHDDLLQCGVAGALAQAVDGAFHLARTGHHRGQGVGHGQTEVVMAMHGEHRLVGIGDALEQLADGVGVLVRNGVADGVRNVDGTCAGVDGSLDDSAEEIDLRAPGVLAGKLHVGAQAARLFHRAHCLLHHLVRLHAQLVLHVDRAGGDKGVDAPGVGAGQRFGSAFDVEARLDHVYLQPLQRPGDAQLFLTGHGRAGTLLAVAQGGVEDDDAIVAAHRTVLTAAERL